MEMTVELFDNIINTSQDCVFWKDKERRFLGVNQAFLDFYGFESADILIGKTDEDMGWHSDPEPFRQDELRVLAGRSTYKVQGKCIIRGEERDIIASKRPLYEGDKIVGLVGSFVDITDVLRLKGGSDRRMVYTISDLREYSFFDRIVDGISLDEILDPLTGVLSRRYAMRFVQSLISEKRPFTYTLIDLDNFKYFNDSFGHSAGDKVLRTVTAGLAKYTAGHGIVGRFGGDELLLIDLKNISNSDKKDFFEGLYSESGVLRTNIEFDNGYSYITATSGAASYPKDADNFDDLFSLIDKMLYLGKSRGRNCYSVYDGRVHKNVEITKLQGHSIYSVMSKLKDEIDSIDNFEIALQKVMPILSETLQVKDLYYVREDGKLRSVRDKSFVAEASDIAGIMEEDLFSDSTLTRVEQEAPSFFAALKDNGFESAMVVRIRKVDRIYGYLVCAVKRSLRIWQENERAEMFFLAGLMTKEWT